MTPTREYHDPRLVALYDIVNPRGEDTDFYLDLVRELEVAGPIIDVGCGTGVLAAELAERGHRVTGVDPSPAMLARARARTGAVRWLDGDAGAAEPAAAELVLMTGHVAQVITDDAAWAATLRSAREALRPGGRLAFESRNPAARAWEMWTPLFSREFFADPDLGRLETWLDGVTVAGNAGGDLVRYELHHLFTDTGEELVSSGELRFRSRETLTEQLGRAGLAIERVFGDWDRRPATGTTPELIVVAGRAT